MHAMLLQTLLHSEWPYSCSQRTLFTLYSTFVPALLPGKLNPKATIGDELSFFGAFDSTGSRRYSRSRPCFVAVTPASGAPKPRVNRIAGPLGASGTLMRPLPGSALNDFRLRSKAAPPTLLIQVNAFVPRRQQSTDRITALNCLISADQHSNADVINQGPTIAGIFAAEECDSPML